MNDYDHKEIESKWQKRWAEEKLYESKQDSDKPKAYVLDMFPYPSGEGLHVGHPKGYIATDVYSRMKRMQGHNVLHPMGWDAFGLPAENFAIKHKVHPREAVEKNIATFKSQLSHIGFDYDWSREINTTDPAYYKWTQWIFIKLFEKGLAYESHEPINWCPSCQTGLANEDLNADGTCERCDSQVEKKPIRQWVLKIRDYADRLLEDLETLDQWPEHIKEQQRNWIGRSEGAELEFDIAGSDKKIKVFTTRPDTLFGATYIVLAPEHTLIKELDIKNRADIEQYIKKAQAKTEMERTAESKEKTGVLLEGVNAINPATKEEIPVFIADYVLSGYGTGAIMAVPAHDERDFAFAKAFDLPITQVVVPCVTDHKNPHQDGKEVVERDQIIGVLHDPKTDKYLCLKWKHEPWVTFVSGGIEDGESAADAMRREVLEETGYKNIKFIAELGCAQSRFYASHKEINRISNSTTILFELIDDEQEPITEEELAKHEPVWLSQEEIEKTDMRHAEFDLIWPCIQERCALPYTGAGMLRASGEFSGMSNEEAKQNITEHVKGEKTITYKIQDWVFSRQRYWGEPIPIIHCEKCGPVVVPEKDLPVTLPEVDHYEPTGTGESPLANIEEWVNTTCPKCGSAGKRETNTMPQWAGSSWYWLRFMDPGNDTALVAPEFEKYWSPVDVYVGGDHAVRHLIYARFWHKFLYDIGVVSTVEPFPRLEFLGFILAEDGRKMSKRWGNVINPDDVVDNVGADSFRVYEMFMGPFENTIAWSTDGLVGARRFVERVWRLQEKVHDTPVEALETEYHKTVAKVGKDIEEFKFNTAISQMMIFINAAEKEGAIGKEQYLGFLKTLAPFAPHMTEELWTTHGGSDSIHVSEWPEYDASKMVSDMATVAVQVAGKVRGTVEVSRGATEEEVTAAAKESEKIRKYLDFEPKKVIFVPDRVINFIP